MYKFQKIPTNSIQFIHSTAIDLNFYVFNTLRAAIL